MEQHQLKLLWLSDGSNHITLLSKFEMFASFVNDVVEPTVSTEKVNGMNHFKLALCIKY